jgi:Uma2 family endonuclease
MTMLKRIRGTRLPARLTVADVYRLQEEGVLNDRDSFELIEGEIVPMAAAKANAHEQMKSRLVRSLVTATPGDIGVYVEPSITFSEGTLLEPDIALWPFGAIMEEVRGPDLLLVVEVANSSLAFDLRVKSALYASFGVRDYWVVDAVRYTIRVHRDPQDGRYADIDEFEAGETVSSLLMPDVRIRLSDYGDPIHRV